MIRIPPSIRLRRAIQLRSLSLVRRIVLSSPQWPDLIRNNDLEDSGNTSLHLAARLGLVDIAAFLLDNGHETQGVTRNLNGCTALMIAAQAGPDEADATVRDRVQIGKLIVEHSSETVHVRDKEGKDAFLHAASSGTLGMMTYLLSLALPEYIADAMDSDYPDSPATTLPPRKTKTTRQYYLESCDAAGNTPLHLAAAAGELKTVRLLISIGADEYTVNTAGWNATAYSASVSAEVYLKGLVREREAQKVLSNIDRAKNDNDTPERRRGQVRVVPRDGGDASDEGPPGQAL